MKEKKSLKKKVLNWEETGKHYVNWVASTHLRDYFFKNLNYENFSLWWITNLCSKDNVLDNKWYYQLKDILFEKKKFKYNKIKFFLIFCLKFIKSFIDSLLWCFLIKILSFTRFKKISKKNCFFSYQYNFFSKNNLTYDRNFGFTPYIKNKKDNYHLISIANKNDFIYKIIKYKKDFKKLNIPHYVSDEFIKFSDIFKIYYCSIISLFKLMNYIKTEKNIFYINKKNCSNVLKPMLINSFAGNIQAALITSKSLNNFFDVIYTKNFINYGEFTPHFRSTYFFLRKSKSPIKIITTQHAYANKNLLYNFSKRNEFSNNLDYEGKYFSPSPDYYLLQGKHFGKLLKKYYPKKTKVIGSLKYDLIKFKSKKKIKNKNPQRTILICPSVGDEDILISCLKKCDLSNVRLILSPQPILKRKTLRKFNYEFNNTLSFEIFDNLSSFELIFYSDLVVCSTSTLALESLICGVPSLRVINPNYPHFFDLNDGVKNVCDLGELNFIINGKANLVTHKKAQTLSRNFFYKLDNKAYYRFWNFIKKEKL